MPNIMIEGSASIGINTIMVICAHCNHHESEGAKIEFNAREQKILFSCRECKKMNEIVFGQAQNTPPPPLPRSRMGR
ncbi:MAG: hypothetical protein KAH23_06630 [Kiritimatiellae bacterium]|nr:hypothetical protein [Kiritimatiellia bacterium]